VAFVELLYEQSFLPLPEDGAAFDEGGWRPLEAGEPEPEDDTAVEETLFRLTERNAGGVLVVTVERISYRQEGRRARLVASTAPVSYIENRESGRLLYRVQWGSARETAARIASGAESVASLRSEFEARSAGGFPQSELGERLPRVFGEGATPLAANR